MAMKPARLYQAFLWRAALAIAVVLGILAGGYIFSFDQWCRRLVRERTLELSELLKKSAALAWLNGTTSGTDRTSSDIPPELDRALLRSEGLLALVWVNPEQPSPVGWQRWPGVEPRMTILTNLLRQPAGADRIVDWRTGDGTRWSYAVYPLVRIPGAAAGRLGFWYDFSDDWRATVLPMLSSTGLAAVLLLAWLAWVVRGQEKRLEAGMTGLEQNLKEIFLGNYDTAFAAQEFTLTQRMSNIMNQMYYYFSQDVQKREQQFERDPLTGLYARGPLLAHMEEEIRLSKQYGRPFSFIMIDLDHFKKFNDTYGHLMGDKLLSATAGLLLANTRQSDIVGRYGGEELAIVLPGTPLKDAVRAAEKLRRLVEQNRITYNEHSVSVTLSLGVTSFLGGEEDTVRAIVQRADQALYEAKQSGRNQVRRNI